LPRQDTPRSELRYGLDGDREPQTEGKCVVTRPLRPRDILMARDAVREIMGSDPSSSRSSEVRSVALHVGDRVEEQARSTELPTRMGSIEEVVRGEPSPRYRIRWDDGHESVFTPSAGSLHKSPSAEKKR